MPEDTPRNAASTSLSLLDKCFNYLEPLVYASPGWHTPPPITEWSVKHARQKSAEERLKQRSKDQKNKATAQAPIDNEKLEASRDLSEKKDTVPEPIPPERLEPDRTFNEKTGAP